MEILRIGKYAIKISLTNDESKEYKLQNAENYNDQELKEAFSRLLKEAKELVDFSYSGRKIFTEIYPSKDGGCEVFVSTVNIDTKNKSIQHSKPQKKSLQMSIYETESFSFLLKMCFRLSEIKFKGKSSVYYNKENKHYFLVLEDLFPKELKYAFLVEYSSSLRPSALEYIKEYYKCVIKKGGVKLLSPLAN